MPYLYENSKTNFSCLDHFKEVAVKTINEIYGREKPLDVFDFSETHDTYKCVAYYDHEDMPDEQAEGEVLSQDAQAAIDKFEDVDKEELEAEEAVEDEGETNDETKYDLGTVLKASDAAMKLAAEKGVDLKLVTGTGADGNITKGDVEKFLKQAPAEENANEIGDEQSNA